jgi:hypothetical protein
MNQFIVETKNVKEASEYHTSYFFLATSGLRMPPAGVPWQPKEFYLSLRPVSRKLIPFVSPAMIIFLECHKRTAGCKPAN